MRGIFLIFWSNFEENRFSREGGRIGEPHTNIQNLVFVNSKDSKEEVESVGEESEEEVAEWSFMDSLLFAFTVITTIESEWIRDPTPTPPPSPQPVYRLPSPKPKTPSPLPSPSITDKSMAHTR